MSSWWTHLVERAPAEVRPALALPGLDVQIAQALTAARARWPEATAVTDDALIEALATGLAGHKDAAAALARLRLEDLLLARWCATGDARAIAAFEQVHRPDLDGVLARFRRLAATEDELRQAIRIKLFVAAEGRAPRIRDYAGFGFLQNWLRVTALRALVDIARAERTRRVEELLPDEELLAMPELGPDVASRYTRAEITRALKHAFARAVTGLSPRQRNFLRHAQVDGLTLDQIAATYGVHRATVARTLAAARAELAAATRAELAAALGLPDDALDSLVRDADSRLDLSLSRVLASPVMAQGTDGADGGEAPS